jgi:hypothetical protein
MGLHPHSINSETRGQFQGLQLIQNFKSGGCFVGELNIPAEKKRPA